MRTDVTFASGAERCAGWRFTGEGQVYAGGRGRPCVIMAPGFGTTRDSGLEPFAARFAAAGLDVLLFDYRTFADSTGDPRRHVDWRRQREDLHAAVAFARGLDGVDSRRIALWGTSYAGGHVLSVAAEDPQIAAVVAQVPATDGLVVLAASARHAGPGALARATAIAMIDALGALTGRPPVRMPIVGPPGTLAAMTTPDALPGFRAIAGPSFVNDFCARGALLVGTNRPITRAGDVRCPLLVQVAEQDSVAPAASARKAAGRAPHAELRSYPVGHFDVYLGETRERVLGDQLDFLARHLAAAGSRDQVAASPGDH
ncbi:MAG TPA: alpha/beta fold hydrolase [Solirubrobacteraceae bacterium]|nr:alpha/beta fold hydrolase [Solirubrobacteraceae bacterium]